MYTEQELQWIQEFIDTRFDGVDASDEMITLMEKSGLLKSIKATQVTDLKEKKALAPKLTYENGALIEVGSLIQ